MILLSWFLYNLARVNFDEIKGLQSATPLFLFTCRESTDVVISMDLNHFCPQVSPWLPVILLSPASVLDVIVSGWFNAGFFPESIAW